MPKICIHCYIPICYQLLSYFIQRCVPFYPLLYSYLIHFLLFSHSLPYSYFIHYNIPILSITAFLLYLLAYYYFIHCYIPSLSIAVFQFDPWLYLIHCLVLILSIDIFLFYPLLYSKFIHCYIPILSIAARSYFIHDYQFYAYYTYFCLTHCFHYHAGCHHICAAPGKSIGRTMLKPAALTTVYLVVFLLGIKPRDMFSFVLYIGDSGI